MNPPKKKLEKRTSVQCLVIKKFKDGGSIKKLGKDMNLIRHKIGSFEFLE
jgi:hypothetical protein